MKTNVQDKLLQRFEQFFWGMQRVKEIIKSSPLPSQKHPLDQSLKSFFKVNRERSVFSDIERFFQGETVATQETILDRAKFTP